MTRLQTTLFLLTIFGLLSCTGYISMSKRKYNGGYYLAISGKGTNSGEYIFRSSRPKVNDQEDHHSLVILVANGIAIERHDAHSPISSSSFIRSKKDFDRSIVKPASMIRVGRTSFTKADSAKSKDKERVLLRRAKIAAFSITGLMVASCLIWQISPAIFYVFLGLMLIAALIAIFAAYDVKIMHKKKEKYPGKGMLIWARVMAILAFPFAIIAKATDKALS